MFIGELAASLNVSVSEVEVLLAATDAGAVLVTEHPSPDRHIVADLRIVVDVRADGVAAAQASSDRLWNEWLRTVLQQHRCA
ncbi:hypothetical protein [Subtercola lobariae]|uniref:Uncharacterized protein n=1 Tax=Subtercola lobariae TaxID=1588641 RepID=A0A917B8V3_9MICO|nr:hypothetical protein [Subtercola lobariae]GGF30655.1 hypothetical protein GCM10011399_24870 [Subtercola lobariae]